MNLTRREYATPEEKRKDFWLGFKLWWAINILLGILILGVVLSTSALTFLNNTPAGSLISIVATALTCAPLLINIGLIVYFALTRSQIAGGMLAAFAVALGIVVILGIIFAVACFVILAVQH